jgi:hypothetical protein
MNYAKARELAGTWVRLVCGEGVDVIDDRTMKRPYGWVFSYNNRDGSLAGNAPIIIDRVNGELRVTGTARPIAVYLAEYESTLPVAKMQMSLPIEP